MRLENFHLLCLKSYNCNIKWITNILGIEQDILAPYLSNTLNWKLELNCNTLIPNTYETPYRNSSKSSGLKYRVQFSWFCNLNYFI
jgi:hypothetical protein